jgi:hypothetical protein
MSLRKINYADVSETSNSMSNFGKQKYLILKDDENAYYNVSEQRAKDTNCLTLKR